MVFDGKHIVVIGGSAGIGKTTALNLAKRGATLTIVGRNELRLSETLKELKVQMSEYLSVRVSGARDNAS